MTIIYERHPVTPARKAALRAKGYTIIDAAFAPEGYEYPEDARAEADERADQALTAKELKAKLDAAGVKFRANAAKPDLSALMAAFEKSGLTGDEWNNLADEDQAARLAAAKD